MYEEPTVSPSVRVSEMPEALRPHQKLLQSGPRVLSNVQLLAVILGNRTPRDDVFRIADRLMRKYGLAALSSLSVEQWMENQGVGSGRACHLAALFELARRVQKLASREPAKIATPADVHAQTRDLAPLKKEHLVGLYVDSQNHLLARETISIGSLNTTRTHPREILKPAIDNLALGFILVHNHPSGTLVPSADDVEFTRAIARAGELMGIPLYDHVIVSSQGFVSLKEKGLL